MQQETPSGAAATRDDVERALADWLDEHAGDRTSLSPWEAHCFALLLTFLRYGYYEEALDQLAYILEPPIPLPIFPLHHLMSFDQLVHALPTGVRQPRSYAAERATDEGAGSSG